MKKVIQIAFGTAFLIFGLNKFLEFLPGPALTEEQMAFMMPLMTSYIWPILGGAMILMGLSALFSKYTALMLVVFAPIMINIFLFNVFFSPDKIMMPALLLAMHLYLFFQYRKSYSLMLKPCSGMNCTIK